MNNEIERRLRRSGVGYVKVYRHARGRSRLTLRSILSLTWLILFLPLMLCGAFNLRSTFLPGAEFLRMMTMPATVLAVLLALPLCAIVPDLVRFETSWHRWLFPLVPILIVFVLRDILLHDVPAIANRLVASHGELVVTVARKRDRYYGKRCSGAAYVSYQGVEEMRLCRLGRGLWNRIASNDRLRLSGRSSFFGLDYSRAELVTRDTDARDGKQ